MIKFEDNKLDIPDRYVQNGQFSWKLMNFIKDKVAHISLPNLDTMCLYVLLFLVFLKIVRWIMIGTIEIKFNF